MLWIVKDLLEVSIRDVSISTNQLKDRLDTHLKRLGSIRCISCNTSTFPVADPLFKSIENGHLIENGRFNRFAAGINENGSSVRFLYAFEILTYFFDQ